MINEERIAEFHIVRDLDPVNPREDFDHLSVMACWHRRYQLGDVQPKEGADEWLKQHTKTKSVIVPIWMMDHSGLTLRTTDKDFKIADPQGWDWGFLGFIILELDAVKKIFGVNRITKKIREKARQLLKDEVELYNQFLQGEVWGYVLTDDEGEEESCWGFYGQTLEETGILEHIPPGAKDLAIEAWENREVMP